MTGFAVFPNQTGKPQETNRHKMRYVDARVRAYRAKHPQVNMVKHYEGYPLPRKKEMKKLARKHECFPDEHRKTKRKPKTRESFLRIRENISR